MITIRNQRQNDLEAIAALHAKSWQLHYRGIQSDHYLDNEVETERLVVWKERFANPKPTQHIIIAEHNGKIGGFVCLYKNEDEDWGTLLDNLHVDHELQGQGIGRLLMREAAYWTAKNEEQQRMYLYVFEKNRDAISFYEHLGGVVNQKTLHDSFDNGQVNALRYVWDDLSLLF